MSGLPTVTDAKLPASYEAARTALANCTKIDECQDWADKAEALASYAKQAQDESLRKMADRIQARAVRRCGELLKLIEPGKNRFDRQEGDLPPNRTAAANGAGLSEHQRKTALRVANVPEDTFEDAVESADPLTVTALAELGKATRAVSAQGSAEFVVSTRGQEKLRAFAQFAERADPIVIARGAASTDIEIIKRDVSIVDAWLDKLVTSLA